MNRHNAMVGISEGCDNCDLLLKKLEEREKEIENLEIIITKLNNQL
jgi:hypothetical protein